MEILVRLFLLLLSAISLGEALHAVKEGRTTEFYWLIGATILTGILAGLGAI